MASRLPERYRQACRIDEGYEVRADGAWVEVTHVLRITAPANMVWLTLANGSNHTLPPTDRVMSRRVSTDG